MEQKTIIKAEQLPLSEIMSVGKAFFESGMFADIKSAAQAIVKIQAGQELGIPPFSAMSGIHIIQGKPTVGAGLMAARVKGSGKYDYDVLQQDEKICSIDFYQGKKKLGNSTFTIEDAKKAATKNMDKYPKNMLFARAISNGVKWFCPDVFASAVYTPEEMNEVQDISHEEIKDNPFTTQYTSDDLPGIIEKAETLGDLSALFTANADVVGANEELKNQFTARKAQLQAA